MKPWRVVLAVVAALGSGLLAPVPPAEAGTDPGDFLDLLDNLGEVGLVLSYFDNGWSDWVLIDGLEDLENLETVGPTAVLLGWSILGNAADVVNCYALEAPEGGEVDFAFMFDLNALVTADPACTELEFFDPDLGDGQLPYDGYLPIALFLWLSIDETGQLRVFECADVSGRTSSEGVIDAEILFPSDEMMGTETSSLMASTARSAASLATAATSSRSRMRVFDVGIVPFFFFVSASGPGDGFIPSDNDGVWELDLTISECRSRRSVDLDHYLDRETATALPDTL